MRLLDARCLIYENKARLVDDDEVGNPRYAILSHTWSKEEVLFEDVALGPYHEIEVFDEEHNAVRGYNQRRRTSFSSSSESSNSGSSGGEESEQTPTDGEEGWSTAPTTSGRLTLGSEVGSPVKRIKAGWIKVWNACLQACRDDYDYIWIDTCCIDKSSSTELSEALNRMFEWYASAHVCYVYLEDCCLCPEEITVPTTMSSAFRTCTAAQIIASRWLRRGWTLQELIAPSVLEFFDRSWKHLGDRGSFSHGLSQTTGIYRLLLENDKFGQGRLLMMRTVLKLVPVATKMSWASSRLTTRVEDRAYSLLGLFDINMPLLYGEGDKAFRRLQEEIIKVSDDDSIFAWNYPDAISIIFRCNMLAPSPSCFSWLLFPPNHPLKHYKLQLPFRRGRSFELARKALNITASSFDTAADDSSTIDGTTKKALILFECYLRSPAADLPDVRIALRLDDVYKGGHYAFSYVTAGDRVAISPGQCEDRRWIEEIYQGMRNHKIALLAAAETDQNLVIRDFVIRLEHLSAEDFQILDALFDFRYILCG